MTASLRKKIRRGTAAALWSALVLLYCSGCTTQRAPEMAMLHVIGVYEGEREPTPPLEPNPTAECPGRECAEIEAFVCAGERCFPAAPAPPDALRPQAAGMRKREPAKVIVNVSDTRAPLVLALTAYEPIFWQLNAAPGVRIERVILGGYHAQRVEGLDASVPIEVYTYDSSPCENCWQGSTHFYSYKSPPPELKDITGLDVTSFQGRYRGSEFSIFPGMKKFGPQR